MTATTRPTRARDSDLFYKAAAVGVWALSCYTTYIFVATLSAGAAWSLPLAALLQAGLTGMESAIWRRRGSAMNYIALAADVFVNVGGTSPLMANLDATASYTILAGTFGFGALPPGAELVLAAGLGIVLAAAPEALWGAGRSGK